MWNPNLSADESRKDVSISENNKNLNKFADKQQQEIGIGSSSIGRGEEENLKKFQQQDVSSCVDSGFLSGPQLSAYDSEGGCDIDEDESNLKKDQKEFKQQDIKEELSYIDSGCVDDGIITDSKDLSTTSGHMILDSGIDSGLTEWFCNLSLKNSNQPLNNLDSAQNSQKKSPSTTQQQVVGGGGGGGAIQRKDNKNGQPWEIYYQQNNDGDTQLHLACITQYSDVVYALIRLAPHPCLLDIQNDEAQSALHLAVLTGQTNVVRMLLVAGAEATIRDRNGNTPLHIACTSGNLGCVKALTIPITSSEIQEVFKTTKNDKLTTLHRCTQLPPDLEQRNYEGERCVHLAAQGNHIEILRHLVWFGADINAREGKSGRSPLHIAIEMCNEILANFLLEECEKLNLETATYAGLTAYQMAAICQNEQMQVYLERRGAEPLTPPDSDIESDIESDFDDSQIYDRFGDPGFFLSLNNGGNAINVA